MNRLKLMTIVGTRPEIIKLSEIIRKCERYFQHTLVHTGQNYDPSLSEVFFSELGLREPDFYLGVVGDNLGQTLGSIIARSYEIISEQRPDALLVLGDTNSCLSVISAKRLKVPIFHLEAGNRCFDENLPEEVNRRIIDHTSDVNLCYTEHARRYLLAEGVAKEHTFVVGSPMGEVLRVNRQRIRDSQALATLGLEKGKFFLLSAHREENLDSDENFFQLMSSINAVAETYDMPVIYSLHPRSKDRIQKRGFCFHSNVRVARPLGFADYCRLQSDAYCVISDSGTLAEEAAHLRFPAVSIRTSTERPESLEKGNFVIGGVSPCDVLQAIELAVEMSRLGDRGVMPLDYADENTSVKVVKIIQSYTSIINRMVWRKRQPVGY